jgi:deoxyribodipyrimidine photo-lyase
MRKPVTIVWFRNDLRLADNPALTEALRENGAIIPVYIWDPDSEAPWSPGSASKSWLHHSLIALNQTLKTKHSHLIIQKGESLTELERICKETGATRIYWNRRYEPAGINHDQSIQEALKKMGLQSFSFQGNLLLEPWEIRNKSGKPFQVFTPFWKAHQTLYVHHSPLPAPKFIPMPTNTPTSLDVAELELTSPLRWDREFYDTLTPGEKGAGQCLQTFIRSRIAQYADQRNCPDLSGTSNLSPHLHFGEITPRQIIETIRAKNLEHDVDTRVFLSELGWREFAYNLLYHYPHTPENPLKERFNLFPWRSVPDALSRWQKGRTGIPIVDAGMRQLWSTGTMHNRVRMIAGSFLVKNLLIDWREGARWFWDTLVDADLASNTMGWQWVTGSGADAAPYFRIFNPILQSQKFDPDGSYIRRWIPELETIPPSKIHYPWRYPDVIRATGYPENRVSLSESRMRALAAYRSTQLSM